MTRSLTKGPGRLGNRTSKEAPVQRFQRDRSVSLRLTRLNAYDFAGQLKIGAPAAYWQSRNPANTSMISSASVLVIGVDIAAAAS